MSRTKRCRRGLSFARAFAKRSSSAVASVFVLARLATLAGLDFLRESGFCFALRGKVFDFEMLKCPRVRLKIVELERESQPAKTPGAGGKSSLRFTPRQCYS